MKAYESKNTHEARDEALDNGNKYFADLIWKAWEELESVDYMTAWDEFDFAHNILYLREVNDDLARELEKEAARVYGGTVFYKERMIARLLKEGRADMLLGDKEALAIADDLDGQPAEACCWERIVNGKPVLWCIGKSGRGQYVNENDCALAW